MTTVEAIERDVIQLSANKLAEFREWFLEYDASEWDKKIEIDAKTGKLDALAAEAISEFKDGKVQEI